MEMRKKIYELLNTTVVESKLKRKLESTLERKLESKLNLFLMALIFFNVLAVILETEESLYLHYQSIFRWFEVFSVLMFTAEYLLRLWSITENSGFKHALWGRTRFIFTPMAIIDLLAILPFYLPMLIPFDLRFLRALRLFRIFRLLKVGRYLKSLRTIKNVFHKKKEELLITIFSVLIFLVLSSSLMYFIEREAQPDKFSSIPAALWWGTATLTPIGNGDIYPVTFLGKILGGTIAILGIGLFALPAGILASGFSGEINKKDKKKRKCPYCGEALDI